MLQFFNLKTYKIKESIQKGSEDKVSLKWISNQT